MGLLSGRQKMGAAAILLAASALLSRLIGLIRDKIISWQFGASGEADMYFAAFVVPDIINYLLAGGFMSITIIPMLAKGFAENEKDAWNFFSCVFFWMCFCACVLTGVGEIWAPSLAHIVAPGFTGEQCERLSFFMRLILPAQIFFLGGSCFTAILLLRRQFAVPALTPLIYNGLIILCGISLPYFMTNMDNDFGMTGYCIGVTLGSALGAFLLPMLVAAKGTVRLRPVFYHPWMPRFLWIALPLMLGQTVVMLDEQFLRVFGSMLGEGQVSLLNYGRRIAQVPVALMGQALAMASYPFLVKLLTENDTDRFNDTLRKALGMGIALIIPCAIWMVSAIVPILGIIFQGGRFGAAETLACAPLASLLLLPAPFWILYMVIVRAFYAHGDTITPALTGTIMTICAIPAYYFWAVGQGAWSVAAVSGVSVSLYSLWLAAIWVRRHGNAAFRGISGISAKSMSCALPAAATSWWITEKMLPLDLPLSPICTHFLKLCVNGAIFAPIFLVLATFLAPGIIRSIFLFLLRKRS